jgi:hypothetical protein
MPLAELLRSNFRLSSRLETTPRIPSWRHEEELLVPSQRMREELEQWRSSVPTQRQDAPALVTEAC